MLLSAWPQFSFSLSHLFIRCVSRICQRQSYRPRGKRRFPHSPTNERLLCLKGPATGSSFFGFVLFYFVLVASSRITSAFCALTSQKDTCSVVNDKHSWVFPWAVKVSRGYLQGTSPGPKPQPTGKARGSQKVLTGIYVRIWEFRSYQLGQGIWTYSNAF